MAEILNITSALEMVDGDNELYLSLLDSFENGISYDTNHLLELEGQEDLIPAAKYVHLLKGAALQIGAERLGEAGKALEDTLRGKRAGDIRELTKAFSQEYDAALKAVIAYRTKDNTHNQN